MANSDIIKLVKAAQGFHRPNLFLVEFVSPPGLNIDVERFSMSAIAAPIPGYAIGDFEHSSAGALTNKHTNTVAFNSMNITFIVSKDFNEHRVFQEWLNLMIDLPSNNVGYFDDYVTDIFVYPTDRNGNKLATFQYIECKPETVGDISLAFENENAVTTLETSFSYTRQELITS